MDPVTKANLLFALYIFLLYFITAVGTFISLGSSTLMKNGIHAAVFTAIFYYTFEPVSTYITEHLI
jgi:hypothetical protein